MKFLTYVRNDNKTVSANLAFNAYEYSPKTPIRQHKWGQGAWCRLRGDDLKDKMNP